MPTRGGRSSTRAIMTARSPAAGRAAPPSFFGRRPGSRRARRGPSSAPVAARARQSFGPGGPRGSAYDPAASGPGPPARPALAPGATRPDARSTAPPGAAAPPPPRASCRRRPPGGSGACTRRCTTAAAASPPRAHRPPLRAHRLVRPWGGHPLSPSTVISGGLTVSLILAQRGLTAATKRSRGVAAGAETVYSVDDRGPRRTPQGVQGSRQLAGHAAASDSVEPRVTSVTGNDRIFSVS